MVELEIVAEADESAEAPSPTVPTPKFWILPFLLLMEGGYWRIHAPLFLPISQPCPFELPEYFTSGREDSRDYPEIPGLDFSGLDKWSLDEPALGTLDSLRSRSHSGGADEYHILLSGIVETTMSSGELMGLYQENLVDPSWDIRDEGRGAEGAWLTWSVRDNEEGGLWYGSLTITTVGVDLQQARLSLRPSEPGWPWTD